MLSYAAILMSDSRSNEISLMKLVVEHVSRLVRKFVSESVSHFLALDGHSSRNGVDWLGSSS